MTNKEKIELKDNIINIFNRFNILDHTSTIGGLRDDILRYINSMQEEPVSIDFEQELYNYFGQVKDFTLGMRIAKRFYDMGKNSQDPVSEDVVSAANHAWLKAKYTESYADTFTDGFKSGSQWQKQKDQSIIELAEDHAMFAGMEKMKEQMMKEMPKWKDNWLGHTKKPCITDEIPGHNGKQLCVAGKCISIDDLWTKLSKED